MKAREIIGAELPHVTAAAEEIALGVVDEAISPIKPLTPAEMRVRKAKQDKAAAAVADTRATCAIKLRAAQRKLSEL